MHRHTYLRRVKHSSTAGSCIKNRKSSSGRTTYMMKYSSGVQGSIPTKVILDGLKRSMSRGNSLSDELDLSSVLGDKRAYLYSPVLG